MSLYAFTAIGPPRLHFELLKLNFDFNADPDPAFHYNADSDPDRQPCFKRTCVDNIKIEPLNRDKNDPVC
jgi:hypothetical protein